MVKLTWFDQLHIHLYLPLPPLLHKLLANTDVCKSSGSRFGKVQLFPNPSAFFPFYLLRLFFALFLEVDLHGKSVFGRKNVKLKHTLLTVLVHRWRWRKSLAQCLVVVVTGKRFLHFALWILFFLQEVIQVFRKIFTHLQSTLYDCWPDLWEIKRSSHS